MVMPRKCLPACPLRLITFPPILTSSGLVFPFLPRSVLVESSPIKTLATQVAFYFALQISIEIDTAEDAKLNKQSSLDTALLGISHTELDTLLR